MKLFVVTLALAVSFMQSVQGDFCKDPNNVLVCSKQISDATVKLDRKGSHATKADLQEFCREAKSSASCLENFVDNCIADGLQAMKDLIKPQIDLLHEQCAQFDDAVSIRSLTPVFLLAIALIPVSRFVTI